jgi:hypothetical protein
MLMNLAFIKTQIELSISARNNLYVFVYLSKSKFMNLIKFRARYKDFKWSLANDSSSKENFLYNIDK